MHASSAAGSSESGADDGSADTSGDGADDGDQTGEPPDGPQPARPTDGFLGGLFPIGVFGQPTYTIEPWSTIGINTMLGTANDENIVAFDAEAQRVGMAMIREPLPVPSDDIGREDLLAWLLVDEPDVEANNNPCGGSCVSLIESMASQWRQVDPSRKIFVNVAGPNVLQSIACDYCNGPGDDAPVSSCYPNNDECYPRIIATSDWVSEDLYPVTGWLPDASMRGDIKIVGDALDRLRGWTDKPLFAIIEVSDQRLGFDGTGTRGPTRDEYRAEVWHAIIHGAHGIFYFPQTFNPFEFEAIEQEVLDEMVAQHAVLDAFGPLLQSEADPPAVKVSVDSPLEVTWRQDEAYTWVFVLNTVDGWGVGEISIEGADGRIEVYGESRKVTAEDGELSDEFDPYAVHVYAVPR